jgi:hypothetical protein
MREPGLAQAVGAVRPATRTSILTASNLRLAPGVLRSRSQPCGSSETRAEMLQIKSLYLLQLFLALFELVTRLDCKLKFPFLGGARGV